MESRSDWMKRIVDEVKKTVDPKEVEQLAEYFERTGEPAAEDGPVFERVEELAKSGRYDEAMELLRGLERKYGGSPEP